MTILTLAFILIAVSAVGIATLLAVDWIRESILDGYFRSRAVERASTTMGYMVLTPHKVLEREKPTDLMEDSKSRLTSVGSWGMIYHAYMTEIGHSQRYLTIEVLTATDMQTGLPVANEVYSKQVFNLSEHLHDDGILHVDQHSYHQLMADIELWSRGVVSELRKKYPDQEPETRKGGFYL